jgi:hypothetical protein
MSHLLFGVVAYLIDFQKTLSIKPFGKVGYSARLIWALAAGLTGETLALRPGGHHNILWLRNDKARLCGL